MKKKRKKTICLVTNWYPTKENPYRGVFFKEQAFAVSEDFDLVVIHLKEHYSKTIFEKSKLLSFYNEHNTVEYTFGIAVPLSLYAFDKFENYKAMHTQGRTIEGVGMYTSEKRKDFIRKTLANLVDNYVKEDIDAFYCIDAQREAFTIQCLAEYYKKPYIVAEHAPVPWPGTVISDVNKSAIEKANMFFAISNDKIRQIMMQNIKLPEITYIGNLVDETKYTCRSKNNSTTTFVIVAAHSFYKNYGLFISVMNRLTEITETDFKVLIVGYGSNLGYSKEVESFERQIKQSKFADKAIMISSVPHEQIGEIYKRADAFVMTSIQEGQPVSALEAACCGLPIFSTRCGGVEDYVDEKMGRIYDVMNCEGMAQGIKDFLEGRMSFDADYIRECTIKKFGKKAFAEKFNDAFNRVIEND